MYVWSCLIITTSASVIFPLFFHFALFLDCFVDSFPPDPLWDSFPDRIRRICRLSRNGDILSIATSPKWVCAWSRSNTNKSTAFLIRSWKNLIFDLIANHRRFLPTVSLRVVFFRTHLFNSPFFFKYRSIATTTCFLVYKCTVIAFFIHKSVKNTPLIL